MFVLTCHLNIMPVFLHSILIFFLFVLAQKSVRFTYLKTKEILPAADELTPAQRLAS